MHADASTTVTPTSNNSINLLTCLHTSSRSDDSDSVRIIDLILGRIRSNRPFFGIEVSPTVSPNSDATLDYAKFAVNQPLFTSITWLGQQFAGADVIATTPSVRLLRSMRSAGDVDGRRAQPLLVHLTCERMTAEAALLAIGDSENVLALRGDHVHPDQPLQHAIDLVHLIRHQLPNTCVAVAGYPQVHPQATDASADLQYLQDKCQAGATFIITQLCFSAATIRQFIVRCRAAGIAVPIVVGLYVPASFAALRAMCRVCQVPVDAWIMDGYAEYAGRTDAEFQAIAVQRTRDMIETLLQTGVVGFQFFTLNRFELVRRCVEGFGF